MSDGIDLEDFDLEENDLGLPDEKDHTTRNAVIAILGALSLLGLCGAAAILYFSGSANGSDGGEIAANGTSTLTATADLALAFMVKSESTQQAQETIIAEQNQKMGEMMTQMAQPPATPLPTVTPLPPEPTEEPTEIVVPLDEGGSGTVDAADQGADGENDQADQALVDSECSDPSVPVGTSTVVEVYRAPDALNYPMILGPDVSAQILFPDVPCGDQPPLMAYESPFEDGDYCPSVVCDFDVPQYYWRVFTAGKIVVDDFGVDCIATAVKGCGLIVINHFGPTSMWRDATIDNGFTVAGRVFDMSSPDLVTLVSQVALNHVTYRMTLIEDGANCSVITACQQFEWHIVIVGNGEMMVHWFGIYTRAE